MQFEKTMATKRTNSRKKSAAAQPPRNLGAEAIATAGTLQTEAPTPAQESPQESPQTAPAPEPPEKTVAWLQRCGQRLDEKPIPKWRISRGAGAREAISTREYLMYSLLKIRSKSGRLRNLELNRAQKEQERCSRSATSC